MKTIKVLCLSLITALLAPLSSADWFEARTLEWIPSFPGWFPAGEFTKWEAGGNFQYNYSGPINMQMVPFTFGQEVIIVIPPDPLPKFHFNVLQVVFEKEFFPSGSSVTHICGGSSIDPNSDWHGIGEFSVRTAGKNADGSQRPPEVYTQSYVVLDPARTPPPYPY